jgi:hypothetical protein
MPPCPERRDAVTVWSAITRVVDDQDQIHCNGYDNVPVLAKVASVATISLQFCWLSRTSHLALLAARADHQQWRTRRPEIVAGPVTSHPECQVPPLGIDDV